MVMEAVGKGVIVTPLSANVRHYDGNIEWFTCVDDISTADRTRMIQFAQLELGKEYATWKLFVFGILILFNRKVETRDRLKREKKLFCSYYVAEVYNAVGKDLKKNVSDRFMTPDDVAKSSLLKKMGVLKKG